MLYGGYVQFADTPATSGPVTQTDFTDARGYVTRHQFNAAGLLTARTEAHGTARARTTTYEYQSGTHLLVATVDPLSRRTERVYDAKGNRRSPVRAPSPTATTTPTASPGSPRAPTPSASPTTRPAAAPRPRSPIESPSTTSGTTPTSSPASPTNATDSPSVI